jgi:hypothetical protein
MDETNTQLAEGDAEDIVAGLRSRTVVEGLFSTFLSRGSSKMGGRLPIH